MEHDCGSRAALTSCRDGHPGVTPRTHRPIGHGQGLGRPRTKEAIQVSNETKTRAVAGLAAVITGVMLIGTTGLTLVIGWALWAVGLGVVLAAIPSAGEGRPPRDESASTRFSLVR